METRQLGSEGLQASTLGLGMGGMSGAYGPSDDVESIETVHAAVDAGITLLDTADFYGMGHNEELIRRSLRPGDREKVLISLKFGGLRDLDGGFGGVDNRPAAMRNFLAYSLQRLGTDYVDIYRPARLDPAVPIEETVGAIAEQVRAGHIRAIGLSEVGSETIRRAHAVHPITDVQLEYSLFSRGPENGILQTCRELGIGVTAYGVLSRGLLSGNWTPSSEGLRAITPRYQPGNVETNLALVDALRKVGEARGATPAQLAFAWVLAQGDDIVPLVGARTRARLAEALPAASMTLSAEELAEIERAVPPGSAAGERYPVSVMKYLDSER
jgi:aryl-alcohol dehydrogenase-like predicted oxidoreductase